MFKAVCHTTNEVLLDKNRVFQVVAHECLSIELSKYFDFNLHPRYLVDIGQHTLNCLGGVIKARWRLAARHHLAIKHLKMHSTHLGIWQLDLWATDLQHLSDHHAPPRNAATATAATWREADLRRHQPDCLCVTAASC